MRGAPGTHHIRAHDIVTMARNGMAASRVTVGDLFMILACKTVCWLVGVANSQQSISLEVLVLCELTPLQCVMQCHMMYNAAVQLHKS